MGYGSQIGCIVYGGGINVRAFVDRAKRDGFVVVLRDGFATIHKVK